MIIIHKKNGIITIFEHFCSGKHTQKSPQLFAVGQEQIIDMLPMHRHQQCHHTFQYNQSLGTVL